MGGQMQSVNEKDVEQVKTGHGMTKFLIQHKRGEGPNIMIRYWGPETYIPVHSHSYDEMWYVLEGEVEFSDQVFTQGACIYIPKDVPYGPTKAPRGVALLRYAEGAGG